MRKIILATASPYRKEGFKALGIDFISESSDIDESFEQRPSNPEELVLCLAKLKAEAVAKNHSNGIVIGFDSIRWFDNRVLEKPDSKEEAFEMLKSLSGRQHQFLTGIHMIDTLTGKTISRVSITEVFFRALSDSDINKYLNNDGGFKTYAGGHDPLKNYSSTFTKEIKGSYNNLLFGLPTEVIVEMLKEMRVDLR